MANFKKEQAAGRQKAFIISLSAVLKLVHKWELYLFINPAKYKNT